MGLVKKYIADIVSATRNPAAYIDKRYAGYIRMGASPRATINFLKVAKASALMNGRTFVIPEDVKREAVPVLAHRLMIAQGSHKEPARVVERILAEVSVPLENI